MKIATIKTALGSLALLPGLAMAAAPAVVDKADNAFMMISTALVLFMSIPGIALFYGGLIRGKNVLSMLTQVAVTFALVCVLWVVYGYSLAFGEGNAFFGNFNWAMLKNIELTALMGSFYQYIHVAFQGSFACITVGLIVGALAERIRFSAVLIFVVVWLTLSYVPIAHMVWGGGLLATHGALDFAGGTVVHINAGVSALVAAKVLGPRLQATRNTAIPHNIPFVLLGAGLLWFGWFGFNSGSALSANGSAGLAMLTTQIATAAAMMVWLIWERATGHAMSAVGAATGAVVGLVAITPAAGIVSPSYAILIGAIGATASFWAVQNKRRFKVDDVLDVFSCHGVAGIVGAILTGAFAFSTGQGKESTFEQIKIQAIGVGATIVYAAVATFIIVKLIALLGGLRLSKDEEMEGIDIVCHEESAYTSK